MIEPVRESLVTLLADFETLLDLEKDFLRNQDIAELEACHLKKERALAEINALLRKCGIGRGANMQEALEKIGAAAGAKYRSISGRLKENLEIAIRNRDAARKQLLEIEQMPRGARSYSLLEEDGEPTSVDYAY
jgi:hypothetical protein